MNFLDSSKLIKAVKSRRGLYDRHHTSYSDYKHKYKMWIEVCQEVFNDWDTLKPHTKMEYLREVQKRWKNLRTCFTREIKIREKEKDTQKEGLHRRRKVYSHFKKMKFLLDVDYNKAKEDNVEADVDKSDSDDSGETDENPFERECKNESNDNNETDDNNENQNNEILFPETIFDINEERNKQIMNETSVIKSFVVEMMKDMKNDELDEDKQFCLSLVQSLRRMNNRRKIQAKIDILKVLQNMPDDE